jgi:hypothetical protein
MMLRLMAALSAILGGAAFFTYLHFMGGGPFASFEARHLRAMKERAGAPARAERLAIPDFEALPRMASVAEYSAHEQRGITIEGWIQRMLRAADGDIHLELVTLPRVPGGPDTLYVTAEVTSRWTLGSRGWSYEALAAAFRPNRGGATAWPAGPARVRLTGWLLYDYPYDHFASEWMRQHSAPRATGWEMHPVTRIERWDESRGAWDEVAR